MIELSIEQMDEMIIVYLQYVFLAAWRTLPIFLVVLAIGICFRRRLASKYHVLLWALVAIRFLTPVSIVNPWSAQGSVDQVASTLFEENTTVQKPTTPPQRFAFRGSGASNSADIVSIDSSSAPYKPVAIPVAPEPAIDWEEVICRIVIYTVILGTIFFFLRSLVAHIRFARKLDRCPSIDDPNVILSLHRECHALGISRLPLLKDVPGLSTPAVFGLLRGTICLPVDLSKSLTAEELRWVIRHELAHIGRKDSWLMTLASIVKSVHWFNPFAIFAIAKIRLHLEAAADQIAVGSSRLADAAAYGRLLIRIAEQSPSDRSIPALGMLTIGSTRNLERRIVSLSQYDRPQREWVNWFAMLAVLGCAAFFLTDASAAIDELHTPRLQSAFKMPTEFAVREVLPTTDSSQITTRQYEVGPVLQKIDETWPNEAEPSVELLAWCNLFYPTGMPQLDGDTLTVTLSESQAKSMSRMLDAWAAMGPQQISIEFRVIQTDSRYAPTVDWIQQRIDVDHQGPHPMIAAKISDSELKALSHVIYSDQSTEVTNAPKVTIFNGRTVSIDGTYKRPFVTAPIFKSDSTKKTVSIDTLVKEMEIGMKAEFMPTVGDNNSIQFTFTLQNAAIDQVALAHLPYYKSPFEEPSNTESGPASTRGFIAQVPSISNTSISSTIEIASNESILIAAPELFQEENSSTPKTVTLYTITPRIIDLKATAN